MDGHGERREDEKKNSTGSSNNNNLEWTKTNMMIHNCFSHFSASHLWSSRADCFSHSRFSFILCRNGKIKCVSVSQCGFPVILYHRMGKILLLLLLLLYGVVAVVIVVILHRIIIEWFFVIFPPNIRCVPPHAFTCNVTCMQVEKSTTTTKKCILLLYCNKRWEWGWLRMCLHLCVWTW